MADPRKKPREPAKPGAGGVVNDDALQMRSSPARLWTVQTEQPVKRPQSADMKNPGPFDPGFSRWQMRDSNPRRHSQLIYSQPPLAARVICRGITHVNEQ